MLRLLAAECRRSFLEFIRNPVEVGVGVVVLVVVFYGLFLGSGYLVGPAAQFGDRLDGIIVGYVVWILILPSLGSVAGEMQKDAQIGALEQVFLSSHGPSKVFTCRTIANMLMNLLVTLAVLFPILALTGRWLHFSAGAVVPVGALFVGSFGLAFLAGAMALAFKRIQHTTSLGMFVMLFLIMVPFENWQGPAAQIRFVLPITAAAGLLRDQLTRSASLDWTTVLAAYANGMAYAIAGLAVFRWTVGKVKRNGTLGWY
jgi:ABC-2 type transport system permease protein